MNHSQMSREAAFYISICILRQLREMGLIDPEEYQKIRSISAEHYEIDVYCV